MLLVYSKRNSKTELLRGEVPKAFAQYWGRGNLRHFIYRDTDGSFLTNCGENLLRLVACNKNSFCAEIRNRFPGETLSNCFRDSYGMLWVSTYNGIFFQSGNAWKKIGLSKSVEVKSINEDLAGNIWLGTASEIFVLNREPSVIQHYTEENGLVNSHLYGILRDNDGNMWFSHNKGLSVYKWKEKSFQHLSKDDGLQSSEFNAGAYFKAADGELFFGGINGVSSFYPREILQNPHTPPVKITGIKLFDEPYKTDTAYWNIRKLILPYTENSISFEFAMPEYTNPAKNKYLIKMENVDENWIDAGDRRFARYAGLRPGHYVFKVKGANNDGVWGTEPTSIDITIVPPFWQTNWFIALAALLFILLSIGVGIGIQKIRQKKAIQALELQHKIQLERERISRDLHDNVGTQLSLMSKNIDGVINPRLDISDEEKIKNLSSISQTSKEVIFTLRETIWALNKEEISLEELSDKLKTFTQKLLELNKTCRLSFTEDIATDALILSPSEAIHLFRICQEAITNSLKYANASSMQITISTANGKYKICIADDGVGFDTGIHKPTAHYGLSNMKYRAGEINCDFSIDTMPGRGTTITISKK
jgi:signal transduction histidine kinase